MSEKEWKKNIASSSIWIRGLFMLLYFIVVYIVRFLIVVISIFQFVYTIFLGKPNSKLLAFSRGLGAYAYQIILFLTFNTEMKPYPFAEWGDMNPSSELIKQRED